MTNPPFRHDEAPDRRTAVRRQLGLLALGLLVVGVGGLAAGWLFAKSTPQRAASTLVADLVEDEPPRGAEGESAATGAPAPTSGDHRGEPTCGVLARPVGPGEQVATLASGGVVVQYRPDGLDDGGLAVLRELGTRERVLVAPNPEIGHDVVATAWTRRLTLEAPNRELLAAFATAYRGGGPDPGPCSVGE